MLEKDKEAEDMKAKIQQLQSVIDQHDKKYPMKSFDISSGDIDATEHVEIGITARGYGWRPGGIVDDDGGKWTPLLRLL